MQKLLTAADTATEEELEALTLRLTSAVLQASLNSETTAEQAQRTMLRSLLASPSSQQLALALTDRAQRSTSVERAVGALVEVVRKVGVDPALPVGDRLQLRALSAFGAAVPTATSALLQSRVRAEAAPFVMDAEPLALGQRLAARRSTGLAVNLNYLGEEVLGEEEAARRTEKYLQLLERPDVDALSVKLSSVCSQVDPLAFEQVVAEATERLHPIVAKAQQHDKLLYFDMEAYRDLELTCEAFERLAVTPELLSARIGIALQAYLPDTAATLDTLLKLGARRRALQGAPLRIRLVKGANLATETVLASQHRLAVPVYATKQEVDANYKRLMRRILSPEHRGQVQLGLGSHNLFDQCYSLLLSRRRGVAEMLQLEMLEGMASNSTRTLAQLAGGALIYAPSVASKSFASAISYLTRRFDENTSPENFLQSSIEMQPGDSAFNAEAERFSRSLALSLEPTIRTRRTQSRSATAQSTGPATAAARRPEETPSSFRLGNFDNVADTDFTRVENRAAVGVALEQAKALSAIAQSRIAGRDVGGPQTAGFDPSRPGVTPYVTEQANAGDVEQALEAASEGQRQLTNMPLLERAALLERVAEVLEAHRLRLVGLLCLDAGKRVEEADVEVSEAIDFARYYARSALHHAERYRLEPRGITVVTPPWNFPLAIPLGGCFAALMTGNPVILKPAPETPLVARVAAELCWQAGVSEMALQFVVCAEEAASGLITDPRVKTVVLTGATETAQLFRQLRPNLHLLAETGGKNGTYVSALSDRDQAIAQCVRGAFGHAGQKCSATSLLILEREVFRDAGFRDALRDAAGSLPVGSAWDLRSFVTPLISPPRGALAQVLKGPSGDAEWLLRPSQAASNPRLTSPGIAWGVAPGSFEHRTEFFGPVLSVLEAKNLKHGIDLLNSTPYGLTAGFFGLSESEQAYFMDHMDAGNLYINRSTTGAVVGRQPFGGRKASNFGPGAKAGGPHYVLQFCHPTLLPKTPAAPRAASDNSPNAKSDTPCGWALPACTTVVGEHNIVRLQPAPTWIVRCPDATAKDMDHLKRAAALVPLQADGRPYRLMFMTLQQAVQQLARSGEGGRPQRFRVVGTPSQEFLAAAAQTGHTVLEGPLTGAPELDALALVLEQTLCLSYHRYGNLSLEQLAPTHAVFKRA